MVDSYHSRRFPLFHLKIGSCSFAVENLNLSQKNRRKGLREADSATIVVIALAPAQHSRTLPGPKEIREARLFHKKRRSQRQEETQMRTCSHLDGILSAEQRRQ